MILVTGGTGLVGTHLLFHLTKNEAEIRAIYRSEQSLEKTKKVFSFYTDDIQKYFSKITWVQADITDLPSLIPVFEGVSQVYHCAALVSFDTKEYHKMRLVNIYGTSNVVNLSIAEKVEKLCFVGSIASVGEAIENKVISEESEWNNQADNHSYAISKYGAEMEVWRASQEGVNVVVVSPGVILGSGFWDAGSSKIFTTIYNQFKYYTEGITGFVSVKDVVKSMILLMNSSIKNEQFILVSENKSFKEIFFLIADNFKVKRPHVNIKPWQTSILWRINMLLSKITGKQPALTKYAAKAAHGISYYSSEKIKKQLSFEFQKMEEVIKEICCNLEK